MVVTSNISAFGLGSLIFGIEGLFYAGIVEVEGRKVIEKNIYSAIN